MHKIAEEIYQRIDNEIYNIEGDRWWQSDFSLNLIKTVYNPARVDYSKKVFERLEINPENLTALEVGCGGGIFSEELARIGFITTGIDPSEQSLTCAKNHLEDSILKIKYINGRGENLQFQSNSFDVVFCCDVLEHVHDLTKVISEISRVLKHGGIFIYDTYNRTFMSKICTVKVLQKWKRLAILPRDIHVWEMFIKPEELKSLLCENKLEWKEHLGIEPDVSYLKMLRYLRKRAAGELSYEEFSKKFHMVESSNTQIMYIGYAVKK